jgi:AcrR family transcriptional regulator
VTAAIEFLKPLSPRERQERNRREMTEAILAAARVVMRRDGVAALNLHEIARMVGVQTSALYKYFPSKAALYDELFRRGMRLVHERFDAVYREHGPGWERLGAWAETRLAFAYENPDLEHLLFGRDVPGFTPSEESLALSRKRLAAATQAMQEIIDAGVIDPGMPVERARDLFLAMTSGLTTQHLANEPDLPVGQGRFGSLIPDAIRLFQAAWTPKGVGLSGPSDRLSDASANPRKGVSDHAADSPGDSGDRETSDRGRGSRPARRPR